MDIQIQARNFSLNQPLRDYVEKKLNRLDRYLPQITDIHLDLSQEHYRKGGDHSIAQLTVRDRRGTILRAEEKSQTDIFAAVDSVTDKIYRQISRYKGKRRRHAGDRFESLEPELAAAESVPLDDDEGEESTGIMRRKEIELSPMSEQEAIDQLELLGHAFFLFYNAQSGAINVVYRREDSGYGLLIPAVA